MEEIKCLIGIEACDCSRALCRYYNGMSNTSYTEAELREILSDLETARKHLAMSLKGDSQ